MKVQKLILIALAGLLVLGCFGAAVAADDTLSAAATATQESIYEEEESSAVPGPDTENMTQIRVRGSNEAEPVDKVIIITTSDPETTTTDTANSTEDSGKIAAAIREEAEPVDKVIIITTSEPETTTTDAAGSTEDSDKLVAASVIRTAAGSAAALVDYVIDKSSAASTFIEEKGSRLAGIVENAIESDSDSLNAIIARKAAEEVEGFVKKIYAGKIGGI